jgi:hypothetical protein
MQAKEQETGDTGPIFLAIGCLLFVPFLHNERRIERNWLKN